MRHLAKRVGAPGNRVEQAGRAVNQHQPQQFGDIVGKDVIPRLPALAAQRDLPLPGGLPPESVRPVGIMSVIGGTDQRTAQDRERIGRHSAHQHDLARLVHDAVKIERIGRRGFIHCAVAEAVDRIRTHIDQLPALDGGHRAGHRLSHPQILHQRGNVAALVRGQCRQKNHGVIGFQHVSQLCRGFRALQIDVG